MKIIAKILNRFILVTYDMIKNIAGAVLLVIILLVSYGIVKRYIFNSAATWVEELCCLLLIWLCYLSASLTTVAKEHVVADFISGTLPGNMKRALQIIIRAAEILFFAVVAYSAIILIPKLTNTSAALGMPRYLYYIPVVVFSAYMALAIIVDLMNDFVPGYDFFAQRKAEQEKIAQEKEQKENEEMLKRVDAFMYTEEQTGEEEGHE